MFFRCSKLQILWSSVTYVQNIWAGCYITFLGTCPVGQVIFQKGEIYLPKRKISLARKKIYGLEYDTSPQNIFFLTGGSFSKSPNKKEPPSVFLPGAIFVMTGGYFFSCIFFLIDLA